MIQTNKRFRYRPVLAVLLLPSLLLIGVFSCYPAVRSLVGGFYQWNGFSPPTYAGIAQFKQYVEAPTFATEAKNIAILTLGSILITLVSQFTAAEIVTHMPRRASLVAKYVLVLPIVLPPLVLIEMWAYLFQPGNGLIDKIFGAAGLPEPGWLTDPHFIPVLLLTNGGPGTGTLVPGLDMYQSAFSDDQYGYGMAIGTLLFLAMLVFTLAAMRLLRSRTA